MAELDLCWRDGGLRHAGDGDHDDVLRFAGLLQAPVAGAQTDLRLPGNAVTASGRPSLPRVMSSPMRTESLKVHAPSTSTRRARTLPALVGSILRLLGLDLSVPDHSTLSRRGRAFAGRCPRVLPSPGTIHLVLDSTGLELFGRGEWNAVKHGRTRRNWRKLHLAVDADTGQIATHVLTDDCADDAAQVPLLLRDVEGHIASVTADGAYDGDPTYQAVVDRQRRSPQAVIIPPRASAVLSTDDPDAQNPRDRHIKLMAERGCIGWQRTTAYGRRNHAEPLWADTSI